MDINQITFDESMETYIDTALGRVCLILSDGLYAYEEDLTDEYKEKIVDFLSRPSISIWYKKAVCAAVNRGAQVSGTVITEKDLQLQHIYILFEQNDPPLFGLSFRAEYDIEHGCGMKIKGESFDIAEIGSADVAFC